MIFVYPWQLLKNNFEIPNKQIQTPESFSMKYFGKYQDKLIRKKFN